MLRLSSIPKEYYLGDLPGTLQYNKDKEEIMSCEIASDADDAGFSLCEHSQENLNRVTPLSQRKTNWKILLMMSKEIEDGEIWLKAALLNQDTGKIALLTSTNSKENLVKRGNRSVKTVDGRWFVGHYRMSAPLAFWAELKGALGSA